MHPGGVQVCFSPTTTLVTLPILCGSLKYELLRCRNRLRETHLSIVSDLVSRAQAGDLASYEEIVRRFQAWAFSRAFSILGDSHLAEDAVQDAFVEAFRNLGSLLAPEAFPSWFQRIVLTACNRITRKRALPASSLDEAQISQRTDLDPSDRIERKERDRMVHIAIQSLSDNLRMVTALYFIGGMSQREVGDYLGLSESVVKKRLFDARRKLRRYLTNMAKSISDERMPAEEISARVIAELISRPQPLLIEDHPIRQIVDQIKATLPDYEVIESREVEDKEIYPSIQESYFAGYGVGYHLDTESMLRTQTSGATLRAIKGRRPPVRLLCAGRVYRAVGEDDHHLKVFHQLDGVCVAGAASLDELRATLSRLLSTVLGPIELSYREEDLGFVDHGMEVYGAFEDRWRSIAGCGMLKPAMLREAGHDPDRVQGYAYGIGLERLAQLKLGLKSIHELWRRPYLQPQP